MAELLTELHPASWDLPARTAAVARVLAAVLDERCSEESGARAASAFLREWADAVGPAPGPDRRTPLSRMVARYRLAEDELDLVVLAGLPHEHEGLATTLRSLHPHGEPWPTAGLAALVLGGGPEHRARVRALLSTGPAVSARLLRVEESGPLFDRSLSIEESVWSALHGVDAWPRGLVRVAAAGPPPGLDSWCERTDVRACVRAVRADARCVVLVHHLDASVGISRCQAVAAAAGTPVVAAEVAADDRERIALLSLHAVARGAVPLVVVGDRGERPAAPLLVDPCQGPVLVSAPRGSVRPPADRALLTADGGPAPLAARRAAWTAALPGLGGQAAVLASRHPLDPAVTAQLALDLAVTGQDPDLAHVSSVVRTRAGATLPVGALLTTPQVDWDQLVLPEEAAAQLHAAVDRLDQQATVLDDWGLRDRAHLTSGVRLLLTGPPGTGKSLCAAALATAAATDLMVVDVSRLVSKWLGETEKNLASAFDAAERTGAVLLLDEADALFGARTEISDAHDRYANLETAYLLQRMERFDGLVVLTSNLRGNIDTAFTRRLDFVIELTLPDASGRLALWDRYLPEQLRAADLDLGPLARLYPVPGAWIRNAAVAAAFASAAARTPITQRHLVDAVRREYRKASTPFPGVPPEELR